jgi:hypothetical protein
MRVDRTTFPGLGDARWPPAAGDGSALSARRAFVVHLAATDGRRRRRFSGRVEHLASGASRHFSSLEGLLAFLVAFLDVTPGGAPSDHAARGQAPDQAAPR